MRKVTCRGAEINYERRGDGPRLLYCNGSGTSLAAVRPMLDMLASRFDLLAFDYRGMGASGPVSEPYTMADLVGDMVDLLDAVGWDRMALAGLSFGGMVAQEFAVRFPERLDRLALLATSPGGKFPSYPLEELGDLPAKERISRSLLLLDRRWTTEWLTAHPDEAGLAFGFASAHNRRETEAQARGRMLQLQARKGHDVLDRLHRITCPALVGSGCYDDIAPPANGQVIADRIPGAQFRLYEGGHAFLAQDPRAWSDLAAFLNP